MRLLLKASPTLSNSEAFSKEKNFFMQNAPQVCKTTRDFLQTSARRTKHATITQLQACYRALPIMAHRQEFLDGKRGRRDGKRAAVLLQASELKNAESRVLAWFIGLHQMGYNGTVAPEDVMAAQVRAATGGLCSERTFRRALKALCEKGWLSKHLIPTGTKVPSDQGWKTLQVNKITITAAAKLIGRKYALSDKPLPRPKRPAMLDQESPKSLIKNSSDDSYCNKTNTTRARESSETDSSPDKAAVGANAPGKSSRPGKPDLPGQSEVAPTSAPVPGHVKQQSMGEPGKARKPALEKRPAVFGRKSRLKAPKTYANARKLFLDDLYPLAKSDEIHRIAELHTDPAYMPLCVTAFDFDSIIYSWLDLDWAARRRMILREILPALKAFVMPMQPPPVIDPRWDEKTAARARSAHRAYEILRQTMTALPSNLVEPTTPQHIVEKINGYSWELSRIPWLLNIGKLRLQDVTPADRQKFREIGDLLNAD